MSFDLNVLVNGNRCKQYYHQGKTFIEAKDGSEYVIEVKNNHYKRVLAVGSVDSLNVLTGKTATPNDSGYIIGAYSSEKIKGFRFSDEEWAIFKFGYKFDGKTYAQSKNDGSEKNCGVIGVKFFYEREPVVIYSNPPVIWNSTPSWLTPTLPYVITNQSTTTYAISASWSAGPATSVSSAYSCGNTTGGYQNNVNYTCNSLGQTNPTNYQSLFGGCAASSNKGGPISPGVSARVEDQSNGDLLKEAIADAKAVRQTTLANSKGAPSSVKCSATKGGATTNELVNRFQKLSGTKSGGKVKRSSAGGQSVNSVEQYSCDDIAVASAGTSIDWREAEYEREQPKAEFDMGTEWGRKEHSKVNTVPFDKGALACSIDIYYASREALIAMGVPITSALTANLPQSFPDKYAQPPAGWVG